MFGDSIGLRPPGRNMIDLNELTNSGPVCGRIQ